MYGIWLETGSINFTVRLRPTQNNLKFISNYVSIYDITVLRKILVQNISNLFKLFLERKVQFEVLVSEIEIRTTKEP